MFLQIDCFSKRCLYIWFDKCYLRSLFGKYTNKSFITYGKQYAGPPLPDLICLYSTLFSIFRQLYNADLRMEVFIDVTSFVVDGILSTMINLRQGSPFIKFVKNVRFI